MPTEGHCQVRGQSPLYNWCGVLGPLPNTGADLEAVALALARSPGKANPEEPCQMPHWWVVCSQPACPLQAWDVAGESPGTSVLLICAGSFQGEFWFVLKTSTAPHLELQGAARTYQLTHWTRTSVISSTENHRELLTWPLAGPQPVTPAALAPPAHTGLSRQV